MRKNNGKLRKVLTVIVWVLLPVLMIGSMFSFGYRIGLGDGYYSWKAEREMEWERFCDNVEDAFYDGLINFIDGYDAVMEWIDNAYDDFFDWIFNVYDVSKNWCINAWEDTTDWFTNAFVTVKDWFVDIFTGSKDETSKITGSAGKNNEDVLEVEGAKLNDIASYKLGEYVDFTIPYGWTIAELKVQDGVTEESLVLEEESIMMSISLKNLEGPKNFEGLNWTREAMIFDMENKYSGYTFERKEIIGDKAAIIEILAPETENKTYMAIVSADEKIIIVTYTYAPEKFVEAEMYFYIALGEMVESLK